KAFVCYSSQEVNRSLQVTTFMLEICQKDFSTNEETFQAHSKVLHEKGLKSLDWSLRSAAACCVVLH
ncbi:hypothetical protein MTO96_016902, partial [Rhipicephalus appendiculatus]